MNSPSKKIISKIIGDDDIRRELARESHLWFFSIYFGHYITYPTAPFQKEIFGITEDESVKMAVISAFRSSAKSSIVSISYPIWAVLGKQQKKCVLLLSKTQHQARQRMFNLKQELESNALLRKDLGPFQIPDDTWSAVSVVLPKYNARITSFSSEQCVRGFTHKQYRPDLIICDDIEDLESVRTYESREKIFQWLMGDIIPLGDRNTKMVIVGTILHHDCLLSRLQKKIEDDQMDGIYKKYPLLNEQSKPLWPGKFPSEKEIEEERRKIPDIRAWQREYFLNVIPDEDQVVKPEWLQYYDVLPNRKELRYTATGIDLAASKKERADYTAMVSANIYGYEDNLKIYILPHPINAKMDFPKIIETAEQISRQMKSKLFVENAACQSWVTQGLLKKNCLAENVSVAGNDKRMRLALTTPAIKNGCVLFPKKGAEILINQLTGFGSERHDDLADAFSLLVGEIQKNNKRVNHMTDDLFKMNMEAGPMLTANMDTMKF